VARLEKAWDDPPVPSIPGLNHVTLFALDATTGKELWSSGDQIVTTNHFSGLSVANGRMYMGTVDGYLYCFGVEK
jgi:outer membrane protein assembly factor BamB